MSAERPATHEPTPTAEPVSVDVHPESTAPSGLHKAIRGIRDSSVMRPFVVRPDFRADVIKSNADIIGATPPGEFDPAKNYAKTHRITKGRHTDPRPEAEAPDPKTVSQSGKERKYALDMALLNDELLEIRAEKARLKDMYPEIEDRDALMASMKGKSWGKRQAAKKAHRAYGRLGHHEHGIHEKFGLSAHDVEAQRTPPAPKQRTPEAQSINTLAKLQGDVDELRGKVHAKSVFIRSYPGDIDIYGNVKRKEAELAKHTQELRGAREALNKHIYAHLDSHPTEHTKRQRDGSLLVHGAKINGIQSTWAIHEDGTAIQLADDGTVLAKYRPNGIRFYVNEDQVTETPDFEAIPQPSDVAEIHNLQTKIQKLKDEITQKQNNGEDITKDVQNLRQINTRLSMSLYDYLYNSPDKAERSYEGRVNTTGFVHGVWGEWALYEDGSSVCRDQDGEVVAKYRPDSTLYSMRTDPYAEIDKQPPREPSGATLDEMSQEVSTRQRLINEAREYIKENHGNPDRADDIKDRQNFIQKALGSLRDIREDYNVTLFQQLRANLPSDAQVRRDGAIIANATMDGYPGRWVIHEGGEAMYLGRTVKKEDITDPDDDSQIKPMARFHRNGFRYL